MRELEGRLEEVERCQDKQEDRMKEMDGRMKKVEGSVDKLAAKSIMWRKTLVGTCSKSCMRDTFEDTMSSFMVWERPKEIGPQWRRSENGTPRAARMYSMP
jgi:hypothetical protein